MARSFHGVALAASLGVIGCAADSEGSGSRASSSRADDQFANATPAAGGGSGAGGGAFGNSGAGTPTTTTTGPLPSANDMVIAEGEECAADSYEAQARKLDIYMVVDDSGSMIPWWPGTLEAINMFFSDPGSEGIGVGVQFFGSDCDAAYYATPRVGIGDLPGHTTTLQQAFPLAPFEGTATVPAMQGAIQHAREWTMQNPDSKTVVLLVTDGLPDDCGSTVQGVVDAASEGFNGSPSIQTFVVGIGIGLDALNQFAQAGGTGQALLVQPGAAQELVQALNDIRGEALPCDYALPEGADADVAANTVNMRYTTPDGVKTNIGWVPSAADCDAAAGGWHYDDPNAPARLVACQTSCEQLKSVGGEVQVVLGCPRIEVPLE
ncbi:MAG: VWA domain-containing protein [Myxococcales bacterium]|jgi:hypothetical protein